MILTERIPQPVGRNAKMHAKTSGTDRSVSAIATAIAANTSRNEMLWIRRNSNCKFTDAF